MPATHAMRCCVTQHSHLLHARIASANQGDITFLLAELIAQHILLVVIEEDLP